MIMSHFHNSAVFVGDRKIEQDIRAEVALCRDISDSHALRITVDDGVVHLTGSTETYSQKWAIERAASRIVGVKEVRNYLEVRPTDGDDRDDDEIRRAAMAVLWWDARVPHAVRAHVTDGVVRLDGLVAEYRGREAAEEAVRNLTGVRDVVNEIRLAAAQSPPDLEGEVDAAIRRRFAFACRFLAVTADQGSVVLRGIVPTIAIVDEVERTVRSIPGVKRIENRLLVGTQEEAS